MRRKIIKFIVEGVTLQAGMVFLAGAVFMRVAESDRGFLFPTQSLDVIVGIVLVVVGLVIRKVVYGLPILWRKTKDE